MLLLVHIELLNSSIYVTEYSVSTEVNAFSLVKVKRVCIGLVPIADEVTVDFLTINVTIIVAGVAITKEAIVTEVDGATITKEAIVATIEVNSHRRHRKS